MKLELPKMNRPSSKKQVNNQKGSKIKAKITKSSITFSENKPNLSEDKCGAKHFSTRIYERFHPLAGRKNKPNQTQYKANTNPIHERLKMNANIYYTKIYNNGTYLSAPKTKPIQTQNKPKLKPVTLSVSSFWLLLSFAPAIICPCRPGQYKNS